MNEKGSAASGMPPPSASASPLPPFPPVLTAAARQALLAGATSEAKVRSPDVVKAEATLKARTEHGKWTALKEKGRADDARKQWLAWRYEVVVALYEQKSPAFAEEADLLLRAAPPSTIEHSRTLANESLRTLLLMRFMGHPDLLIAGYFVKMGMDDNEINHRMSAAKLLNYMKTLAGEESNQEIAPSMPPEYLFEILPPELVLRLHSMSFVNVAPFAATTKLSSSEMLNYKGTMSLPAEYASGLYKVDLVPKDEFKTAPPLVDVLARNPEYLLWASEKAGGIEFRCQLMRQGSGQVVPTLDYELTVTKKDGLADDIRVCNVLANDKIRTLILTSRVPLEYTFFSASTSNTINGQYERVNHVKGLSGLFKMVEEVALEGGAFGGPVGVVSSSRVEERAIFEVLVHTKHLLPKSPRQVPYTSTALAHTLHFSSTNDTPLRLNMLNTAGLFRRLSNLLLDGKWAVAYLSSLLFISPDNPLAVSTLVPPKPFRPPAYASALRGAGSMYGVEAAKGQLDVHQEAQGFEAAQFILGLCRKKGWVQQTGELTASGKQAVSKVAQKARQIGYVEDKEEEEGLKYDLRGPPTFPDQAGYKLVCALIGHMYPNKKSLYGFSQREWTDLKRDYPPTIDTVLQLLSQRQAASNPDSQTAFGGSPPVTGKGKGKDKVAEVLVLSDDDDEDVKPLSRSGTVGASKATEPDARPAPKRRRTVSAEDKKVQVETPSKVKDEEADVLVLSD